MYGTRSGTAVCGFVTSELSKSRAFRIVERSRLKSIMDEQNLQTADLVDTDTAVRVGKMLGVHAVMVGSVCQYDMDKTTVYVHVVPIVSKDYKVGATIRMIDVRNGEIIYAHSASGGSGANFTDAGKLAAQSLLRPLLVRVPREG
jgi:curli biogenesis system outer membrane secretion channel CsgG